MRGPAPSLRPIPVTDPSAIGQARRHAAAVAEHGGMDEDAIGRVSLIATELATNLQLHGGGGELLVDSIPGAEPGVQLLAIDRGRGMTEVVRCLRDGYSTTGTAGQGLGAVRRLSAVFDVHSQPRVGNHGGTVVLSQVHNHLPSGTVAAALTVPLRIAGVCVPLVGEQVSGDGWIAHTADGISTLLVTDGLGHGPQAAAATAAAQEAFRTRDRQNLRAFLGQVHLALRPTRGAAGSVARIDRGLGIMRFAGVGNVMGRLVSGSLNKTLLSENGTLGLQAARISEVSHPWPEDGLLVLCSDGLVTGWTLDPYPGLARRHPAVIAAVLYRDWSRGRDDVAVVAARSYATGSGP